MRLIFLSLITLFLACLPESGPLTEKSDEVHLLVSDTIVVSEYGLVNVGSICFAENGDLIVLDDVGRSVHVFRDSEVIKTIKTIGEGPQEYTSPTEISSVPGGGFLLNCPSDFKILMYNSEYDCVADISFAELSLRPGTPVRAQVLSDSVILAQTYFRNDISECGTEVALWNIASPVPAKIETVRVRYAESFHPIEYLLNTRIAFSADRRRNIYASADVTTDSYQIILTDARSDTILQIIEGDFEPMAKTDEEIDIEVSRIRQAWIRGTGGDIGFQYEPNPYHFVILGMYFSDDGKLWVRRNSPSELSFDVYDPEFEEMTSIRIERPEDYLNDGWLVSFGDSLLAVAPVNSEVSPSIYLINL